MSRISLRCGFCCPSRFDDHGDAAGPVAFVDDLVVVSRFRAFACAALDRALDVVTGHALRACRQDTAAQPHVSPPDPSPPSFAGDADLLSPAC
jgi:hypothetical protein